jgi:cardiolipin synthase
MLRHVPNAITVARALLIPVIVWALLRHEYDLAFAIFVFCAVGDAADGFLARRYDLHTRFGAIADPLADKLTMIVVLLLLAVHGWLPWWFVLLAIGRDLVIVAGAVTYHFVVGRVEMAPTWMSKLNTALEFLLLTAMLAVAAGWLAPGDWTLLAIALVTVTVTVSGLHYVVVWGTRARDAKRAQRRTQAA